MVIDAYAIFLFSFCVFISSLACLLVYLIWRLARLVVKNKRGIIDAILKVWSHYDFSFNIIFDLRIYAWAIFFVGHDAQRTLKYSDERFVRDRSPPLTY